MFSVTIGCPIKNFKTQGQWKNESSPKSFTFAFTYFQADKLKRENFTTTGQGQAAT
jgi:hypothetical protein